MGTSLTHFGGIVMGIFVRVVATLFAVCSASQLEAAERSPSGCADQRSRQFDFWIGEWRVTENGKLAGHNRIERVLDGCALIENWTGAKGGSGKSLNFFDRGDGLWHQTWIDRSGGALFLNGQFCRWRDAHGRRTAGHGRTTGDPASHHLDRARRWQRAAALGIESRGPGGLVPAVRRLVHPREGDRLSQRLRA